MVSYKYFHNNSMRGGIIGFLILIVMLIVLKAKGLNFRIGMIDSIPEGQKLEQDQQVSTLLAVREVYTMVCPKYSVAKCESTNS